MRGDVAVDVVDSDVSALANVADKVLIVQDAPPFVLHIEPQAYYDEELDDRMHLYAALLRRRHRMPVHTVLIALDRGALGRANRARVREKSPLGHCHLDFRYELLRAWRLPPAQILAGGIGVLPLLPISNLHKRDTPDAVRQMAERIDRELPRAEAADLWTATFVLVGLKYDWAFATVLLRGAREIMKQSSTYQGIIEEGVEIGRAAAKQDDLILLGSKRIGRAPDVETVAAIRATTDLARLDAMLLRVLDADDWREVLAAPA